ncbi:MAG: transcriptional regulator, AraC family [Thermomicrobiales bacterium]|jgi:AraC-like DNA-binding protein|nr:transcriptional regulator, AraC family [Thermomicrobiales bacterium]
MRYREYAPHAVLQDCVRCLWILEKEYTPDDSDESVAPDACVELILNVGAPYRHIGTGGERELPPAFLIGLLDRPVTLRACGVVRLVAVRFQAWGLASLLATTAPTRNALTIDLDERWDAVIRAVAAHVRANDYDAAVKHVEEFLIRRRLATAFDPRDVQAAANLLQHTRGQVRVADLADACYLSARQLERRFVDVAGVPPKTLARMVRFDAVRTRLMFSPTADLTALAHEFGYADQAHFIRDFRAFTGTTPSRFAQEMQAFWSVFADNENVVFLQSSAEIPG